MKAKMNDLLKAALEPTEKKEFKSPAEAFMYGFTHWPLLMVKDWKEMKALE